MATFVNDLRLTELATGEGSGTWGTTTNTNLELIAESFSFGTEAITTNADTHTTTIADGATDPGRSLFLKYTGTLDSACTITIGPNTVSKLWLIENATSGSQSIIIKQGSGATVTIPNGQTKAIYSDGAGSGGAMVDAFQDLSIPDLFVDDDLTVGDDLILSSDGAIIKFGADADTTLTHTDGSGLTLNSTNKIMFNDASQFIQGSSATVLSLGATDEIDLTATAIDVNGTIDVSGNATFGGTISTGGITINGAGSTISDSSDLGISSGGDLTIDVAGDIILDADGGDFRFKDAGTQQFILDLDDSANSVILRSSTSDGDMIFQGNDGGSNITALTLDMSEAGAAAFNAGATFASNVTISTADNSTTLNLVSTDTDANAGPHLRLSRNVTGADNDALGQVEFAGRDDAGNDFLYAQIEAYIVDASNGSEDGYLEIFRGVGGTERVSAMILSPTDTVFNENSGDIDFRVESDNFTHMLFVDAGNDHINIGGSADSGGMLNVSGDIVLSVGSGNPSFTLKTAGTGNNPHVNYRAGDNIVFDNMLVASASTDYWRVGFGTSGSVATEVLAVTTDAKVGINTTTIDAEADALQVVSSGTNTVLIDGTGSHELYSYHDSGGVGWATGADSSYGELLYLDEGSSRIIMYAGGNATTFFTDAATIVNEGSRDHDFRVESDSNANALIVDAGLSHVGINRAANSVVGLTVNSTQTSSSYYAFEASNASSESRFVVRSDGQSDFFDGNNANTLRIGIAGAETVFNDGSTDKDFRIESNGNANLFKIDANSDSGAGQVICGSATTIEGVSAPLAVNGFAHTRIAIDGTDSAGLYLTDSGANPITIRNASGALEFYPVAGSGVVFNQNGINTDFRIESDNNTNTFTVDASADVCLFGKSNDALTTTGATISAAGTATFAFSLTSENETFILNNNNATGATYKMDFRQNNSSKGNIAVGSSSTAYNTSSDYRLKENVETLKDGLSRLAQLKPVQFTWTTDGALSEGFIAHEVDEVFPDAVTGEKDAVDEEGNIAAQQMDYGRITPLLVKAIQEQQEQIEELKAEIAKLKGE